MNNKVSDPTAAAMGKRFQGTRLLPKRGQIKAKIAANAFNSIVSALSRISPHSQHSRGKTWPYPYNHAYRSRNLREKGEFISISTMNKVGDVRASGKSVRGRRPVPKRGQIKSRIAANAFHSIASALSRAVSHRHHSSEITSLFEKQATRPCDAMRKCFRDRRHLPKRGQIKAKIAASAFHSIVSALSRVSSHRRHSCGKTGMECF